MSGHERSGWRDMRLSQRHREWGVDVPANDIDFNLIEYDLKVARALVDYKHELAAWPVSRSDANMAALVDLGDRRCRSCGNAERSLPVFACRYGDDLTWFEPDPFNEVAAQFIPTRVRMTEFEWVALLYKMRGRDLPTSTVATLRSNPVVIDAFSCRSRHPFEPVVCTRTTGHEGPHKWNPDAPGGLVWPQEWAA